MVSTEACLDWKGGGGEGWLRLSSTTHGGGGRAEQGKSAAALGPLPFIGYVHSLRSSRLGKSPRA